MHFRIGTLIVPIVLFFVGDVFCLSERERARERGREREKRERGREGFSIFFLSGLESPSRCSTSMAEEVIWVICFPSRKA